LATAFALFAAGLTAGLAALAGAAFDFDAAAALAGAFTAFDFAATIALPFGVSCLRLSGRVL
jgi:hypothetical protein